ncbi:DUF4850 domain-containing protein [Desulfosporosinus sp. PR]|uniref:DUF4850 domain-containing protein n=1 Tax=Candidatus Desulfosporosinus nitrosoreducens TaxID=3401928 RepID=UPI0027FF0DDD|nr:DUF4850 domain-containing protein [Desulfosporosinus sp. PR]MDQ7096775.1 DUF4850 domain-containing protein [Desulfosporosinus sp. PR]
MKKRVMNFIRIMVRKKIYIVSISILLALVSTLLAACSTHDGITEANKPELKGPAADYPKTEANGDAVGSIAASPEESQLPKMVEHGTVTFHSAESGSEVKLPLLAIAAKYGVTAGFTPPVLPSSPLPEVLFFIPKDQADQLAAFWVNVGIAEEHGLLLIGPRGWRPVEAGVGADGSVGITLENPKDSQETLTYSDTYGGCQGCAIFQIAAYFPSLRKWAEDQGFPGEGMKFQQQTLLNPYIMAYSKEHADQNYEINGVAYQQHEQGNAWFRREEMSSMAANHRLATTVLNYFVKLYSNNGSND